MNKDVTATSTRRPYRVYPLGQCAHCGGTIEKKRPWQRFCGAFCRMEQWNLDNPRMRKQKPTTEGILP